MREIKFRAWNNMTGMMIDLQKLTPLVIEIEGLFPPHSNDVFLMQYTGLLDKNGKQIFEGDVILDEGHSTKYFEVVWSDEGACFLKKQIHSEAPYFTRFDDRDEVVGNRWANPELLQK